MHIDNITAVVLALPTLTILITWFIIRKADALTLECNLMMIAVITLSNLAVGVIYFTTYAMYTRISF